MYARCLRRAAVCPLPRRRLNSVTLRRCLATVEPTSTTGESSPVPPADTTKSDETWSSVIGSNAASNTAPLSLQNESVLDDLSDHLRNRDESEEDTQPAEDEEKDRARTSSSADLMHNGVCIFPELRFLNMPGVLFLLRELEQRFGRIRDFLIIRDKDAPSEYMKFVFFSFKDKESMRKVHNALHGKRTGMIMLGAPPEWDRMKELDGGVGLADIQTYLRPKAPSTDASVETNLDTPIKEAVDSVERALQDAEANTEESQSSDSDPQSSASPTINYLNACECRIEIRKEDVLFGPVLYEKGSYVKNVGQRKHIARSLVQWGGFYPHYQFAEYDKEKEKELLKEKDGEGVAVLSEEEKRVRQATRDMRSMLLRYRRFLLQTNERSHGIEQRGGKEFINWESPMKTGTQHAPAEVAQTDVLPSGPAVAHPKAKAKSTPTQEAPEQSKLAKTKWEKPKALTPEEEESLQRLFAHSGLADIGQAGNKSASTSRKRKQEGALSTASTSSSSSSPLPSSGSQPENSPTTNAEQVKVENTPSEVSASNATLVTASIQEQEAERKEAENRRARRAKRKAQQERAGFKAKLLGLFGR